MIWLRANRGRGGDQCKEAQGTSENESEQIERSYMIQSLVIAACLGGVLVSAAMFLWVAIRATRVLGIVVEAGDNNDPQAVESFVWLIGEARESIETFDDGDKAKGSIYESPEVVEALTEKLRNNPNFAVTSYFNGPATELLFYSAFADHPRVQIHAGLEPEPAERPEGEIHYKIVDGGRLGYVSSHSYSGQEREYRQWDCRHLPERSIKAKAKFLYSAMRQHAYSKLQEPLAA